WVDNQRLYDRFIRLYHLDRRSEGCVQDKGSWVNGGWRWDKWSWLLDEDGVFTVKKLARLVEERILHVESEVYSFVSSVGALWNWALHWFMKNEKDEKVILSFELSIEDFKEIPQSDEFSYNSDLEIFKECLYIFHDCLCLYKMWLLKNYDVEQSWKPMTCYLSGCIDLAIYKSLYKTLKGVGSLIYMKSRVSLIVNGKLKRKR
ncbi:hypothetical protein Tco_1364423, partial [Tanacetum coccineum]